MARKQTAAKTRTTTSKKTSAKAGCGREKSAPSSRAKADARLAHGKATLEAAFPGFADLVAEEREIRLKKAKRPDVWTQEYLNEYVDAFSAYVAATPFPVVEEFCYLSGLSCQRINEHPELAAVKDRLYAKRQANTVRRGLALKPGESPLAGFLAKLAANAGPYSYVEKLETENRTTEVKTYVIPENGRDAKGRG